MLGFITLHSKPQHVVYKVILANETMRPSKLRGSHLELQNESQECFSWLGDALYKKRVNIVEPAAIKRSF
jgi:hypothetical protein